MSMWPINPRALDENFDNSDAKEETPVITKDTPLLDDILNEEIDLGFKKGLYDYKDFAPGKWPCYVCGSPTQYRLINTQEEYDFLCKNKLAGVPMDHKCYSSIQQKDSTNGK